MSYQLTPLEVCERLIGPPPRLSEICGLHPKTVFQWRHATKRHAAGDIRFCSNQRALLKYARANDIPLHASWLITGASSGVIDAIKHSNSAKARLAAE